MKKLLLASLGVFLLSAGIALAGGPGGCFSSRSLELTDAQETKNAIVLVQLDNRRVELAPTSSSEVRYNVKTQYGEELAKNISLEDLSSQFPELYKALKG